MVLDCHDSLLDYYGWIKVVFELYPKECVIWKYVNDVVAHVMDDEVKDFLYGIVRDAKNYILQLHTV